MSVVFGPFSIDTERRLLLREGAVVHLKPKAFDLLAVLIAEAPRVVRKDELHRLLWPGTFVSEATLVGLVKEVRRALGNGTAGTAIIRTAHGVGYAFAAEVDDASRAARNVSWWIVADQRRIALAHGDNLIGRDTTAAVALQAPGVSRRHARVIVSNSAAVIEDLGSKNGTTVNGCVVVGRVPLRDGDSIRVGPIPIIFRMSLSGISTDTCIQ